MILRQLGVIDFVRKSTKILEWTERVAVASAGEFDSDMLFGAVSTGSHYLYFYCGDDGVERGVIYTTILDTLKGKTLSAVGAAGDGAVYEDWLHLTELLNDLAKTLGCVDFEIRGRRGFMRAFKPHGWTEKYTVIGRDCYDVEKED